MTEWLAERKFRLVIGVVLFALIVVLASVVMQPQPGSGLTIHGSHRLAPEDGPLPTLRVP